jgi:hypothetical protein
MKTFTKITTISILTLSALPVFANECKNITEDKVIAAQKAWALGIVNIGKAVDHKKIALEHLSNLYAYDIGNVLFKPTKASEDQFRGTKDEALSYFVTGIVSEDKGFALAPYTKVRFENEGVIIDCDSALAMGNYYFTTTEGNKVKVEYSFGYIEDENGNLKINLHHSSLPYNPKK